MPLSVKQEAVALALAAGRTVTEAAAECSCGVRTIRRWLSEAEGFRQRVQEVRSELFSLAVGRLSDLSGKAASTLGQLLDHGTAGIRLQAARTILEQGPKLRELLDVEDRLAALEKLAAERKGTP